VQDNKPIHLPIWQGQEGEGRCLLTLILTDTGNGIHGLLTGGEKPHIGGVVLALPTSKPKRRGVELRCLHYTGSRAQGC